MCVHVYLILSKQSVSVSVSVNMDSNNIDKKLENIYKSIDALEVLIELENNNKKLKNDYKELHSKYTTLKHEFSENTIIVSMQDMKNENDILNKKLEKYKKCFYQTNQSNNGIISMIDTLIQNSLNMNLKNKLQFIKEVIEESNRKRTNTIYNVNDNSIFE